MKEEKINIHVLNRYMKEYAVDADTAKQHFLGLINFLRLCSVSEYPCCPDKTLDNAWHTFLLFTKDYYSFCLSNFNKFIHHNPINEVNDSYTCYYCEFDPCETERIKYKLQPSLNSVCDGGGPSDCGSGHCNDK